MLPWVSLLSGHSLSTDCFFSTPTLVLPKPDFLTLRLSLCSPTEHGSQLNHSLSASAQSTQVHHVLPPPNNAVARQHCLLCALNILSSFTPPHLCACPPFHLECFSASPLPCQTLAYLSIRLGPRPIFSPKSSLTSLAQVKLPSMSSRNLLFGTLSSAINPVLSAHVHHFTCMAFTSAANPEDRASSLPFPAGLSTKLGHNRLSAQLLNRTLVPHSALPAPG